MKMKKFLSLFIAGAMLVSSMTALAEETTPAADGTDGGAVVADTAEVKLPEYDYATLKGDALLVNAEPVTSGKAQDFKLDAGVVFAAKDTDGANSPFADWIVDYEITFSNTTKAQLMGAYANIRGGKWQNLGSIEFTGGRTYEVMKELNAVLEENYGETFPNTYANIVDFVKEFSCGIVYDKATTKEGTTVTLSLCMTDPATNEKHVLGTETFKYEFKLPECEVTELAENALKVNAKTGAGSEVKEYTLDYGLKFASKDAEGTGANSPFAEWTVDYVIEFSKDATAQLLGQYDFADKVWYTLGSYDFKKGVKYGILEESKIAGEGLTYADVVDLVKTFQCGIILEAATFDTVVTLSLVMTDNVTGEKFVVATNEYATESLHKGSDTNEQIAENINGLDKEDVKVFAEDIKAAIEKLDTESKNAVSTEVIETLVAEKIEENTEVAKAYTAEADVEVTVQPADVNATLPDSFIGAEPYEVIAEKAGVGEVPNVAIPVLVTIPVPAGTTKADIDKIVHIHNGEEKVITDFYIKGNNLYFTMSEFSYIGVFFKVRAATGGAVLKLVPTSPVVNGKTERVATYDVVLEGETADAIRTLVSGDFKVNIDSSNAYNYEFVAAHPEQTTADKESGDVWHFRVVPTTGSYWTENVVDNKLTIGTITVTARGKGTIRLSDVHMNKHDNTSSNGARPITTNVGNAQNYDIIPAKHMLTVNVEFYNPIEENEADYNGMTITISGGDLDRAYPFHIGVNEQGVDYDDVNTYSIEKELSENTEYCVTIEGAGYRKAVYYVNMQDSDKTLNFWNNVEDVAEVIELNNAASAVNTNFLAGDIVRDNEINIYDLSAVVSYFGENGLVAGDNHVQYDLNRDGKIDSMDVAYVLVSWGN